MSPELILNIILGGMIFFAIIGFSYVYYDLKCGVPTYPTTRSVRRAMIALLQEDAAKRDPAQPYRILDLGSGSGQLSWHIARAMPQAQVVGVEISFVPWLRSVIRQKLFGPPNLSYQRVDFWSHDCSQYQAVVTYLLSVIMERVGQKLRAELPSGAFIVANRFPILGGWQSYETRVVQQGLLKANLLLYRQA